MNAGFRVSQSATNPDSIKTDAPARVMWDIFREWIASKSVPKKCVDSNDKTRRSILDQKSQTQVDFNSGFKLLKAKRKREKSEVALYQMNPEKYWGPKSRATGFNRK